MAILSNCKSELFPVANFTVQDDDCLDTCTAVLKNQSLYSDTYEWNIDGVITTDKDAVITFETERRYVVQLTAFNEIGESDVKIVNIDYEFLRLEPLSATVDELPLISPDNFNEPDVYVRFLNSDGEEVMRSRSIMDKGIQDLPLSLSFSNTQSIRPGTYTVQLMDEDESGQDDIMYSFNNVNLSLDTKMITLQNTPTRNTISIFFRKRN